MSETTTAEFDVKATFGPLIRASKTHDAMFLGHPVSSMTVKCEDDGKVAVFYMRSHRVASMPWGEYETLRDEA